MHEPVRAMVRGWGNKADLEAAARLQCTPGPLDEGCSCSLLLSLTVPHLPDSLLLLRSLVVLLCLQQPPAHTL